MDLSALIFVALAVAWAVYLVPKALKHHEEVAETRTVERFSHSMRVLARREPVDHRSARLVVSSGRTPAAGGAADAPADAPVDGQAPVEEAPVEVAVKTTVAVTRPTSAQDRRTAAARAARRRRRVLGSITLALAVVTTLALTGLISGWYVALPATLLVAWLVACRLMVRQERAVRRSAGRPPVTFAGPATPVATVDPETGEIHVVPAAAPGTGPAPSGDASADAAMATSQVALDPSLWDPVPVTLPTYVSKPAATRRTVRTIDLDDTGVWTSGRTDADSQIAREADQAQRAERQAAARPGDGHRAVGT